MSLLALIPLKDWIYCGLIAALLAAFGWYTLHERHLGAAKCVAAVKADVQKQEVHNAQVAATDEQTVQHEAETYAQATAAPPIRPVRVYFIAPRPLDLPAASATGPEADGSSAHAGQDHGGSVPPQSFGPELQAIGRDADAQIAGLQDYITKVCRPK